MMPWERKASVGVIALMTLMVAATLKALSFVDEAVYMMGTRAENWTQYRPEPLRPAQHERRKHRRPHR